MTQPSTIQPSDVREVVARLERACPPGRIRTTVRVEDLKRLLALINPSQVDLGGQENRSSQGRGDTGSALEALRLFLNGEGELEGCAFGEVPDPGARGRFWWRKYLPVMAEAAALLSSAEPVVQQPWDEHKPSPELPGGGG